MTTKIRTTIAVLASTALLTGLAASPALAAPTPVVDYKPGVSTQWLTLGKNYQYPSSGGTWEYGLWDFKVRSNYNVNKYHASSVKYGTKYSSSLKTRPGRTSPSQIAAINTPNGVDEYYYRTY